MTFTIYLYLLGMATTMQMAIAVMPYGRREARKQPIIFMLIVLLYPITIPCMILRAIYEEVLQ